MLWRGKVVSKFVKVFGRVIMNLVMENFLVLGVVASYSLWG